MDTLISILWVVWIVGGFLLFPFNSLVCGFLICVKCNINPDQWGRVRNLCWIFQIIWNFVFCLTAIFLNDIGKAMEGEKISYTLTRGRPHLIAGLEGSEKYPPVYQTDPDQWDWHFYRETAKGKTEIDDYSDKATPFQKATHDTTLHFGDDPDNTSLPKKGLHLNTTEYDSIDNNNIRKLVAFEELPYEEATAYIEALNKERGDHTLSLGGFLEGLLASVLMAVITPFLYTFVEALVVSAVLICISNPLLGAAIFGPTIYRFWKAGAFKV